MLRFYHMEAPHLFQQLGLSDKQILIYSALLSGGPASVRMLAKTTRVLRQAVLEALAQLERQGLASRFFRHKKEFFLAEDPEKLLGLLDERERSIAAVRRQFAEHLPALRSMYAHAGGRRALVRYFEGSKGAALVLRDVLRTMSQRSDKKYRAYSALELREVLYRDFPQFTKERILKRIHVDVIAAGEGGEEQPLSARRWLADGADVPTYKIIYGDKLAYFTMDKDELLAVLIEDANIAATERVIFEKTWEACAEGQKKRARVSQKERA